MLNPSLPTGFESWLSGQLGSATASGAISGYATPSQTTVRLHATKAVLLPLGGIVHAGLPALPWSPEGRLLANRPSFITDPAWHAGAYYVQEGASMAVGRALAALLPPGSRIVLDLCAAPGGKSTHASAVLPKDCLLVANEVIRTRTGRLTENLERQGLSRSLIISHDPAVLGHALEGLCDAIIVDAPCSGEGLFRKDNAAAAEWSQEHVAHCQARQERILADVWPALRPGGLLLYSTCTLNTIENEQVAAWLERDLGALPLALPAPICAASLPAISGLGVRFLPSSAGHEGLFLAAFAKPGDAEGEELAPAGRATYKRMPAPSGPALAALQAYLPEAEAEDFFDHKGTLHYLPATLRPAALRVLEACAILRAGTPCGELATKGLIPDQALATLTRVLPSPTPTAHQTLELTLEQALTYLRRAELRDVLDSPQPGLYLATYHGLGLGWLRSIQGGRMNNLLPVERRILKN